MTARICLSLLLSCFWVGEAIAEDASAWLDRMSHGFRELTYRGTLSYQRGDSIQSLRIAHTVIDGKEYERLDYLDGDQREVVRRDHSLSCIHSGHKLVRFLAPPGAETAGNQMSARVSEFYAISLDGRGRLAGRQVVNLQIVPRDEFRYGYRLALDEHTGLMVRSELLGQTGEVLERFQFAELEIGGDIPEDYFGGSKRTFHPDHLLPAAAESAATQARKNSLWAVRWTPEGFILAQKNRGNARKREMLTYTDGMSVFSVFVEVRDSDQGVVLEGKSTKGATSAYFRTLQLAGRPHRVTVVGEIPMRTAQRVAQSVTAAATD